MKKRKLLSWILAICMVMSLVPAIVFADGGTSPVQIEVKNAQNGITQYKVNTGDWITLNESKVYDVTDINANDQIFVRAIPNSEQELDAIGTQLRVDGIQEPINNNDLKSDGGWSFTYYNGKNYQVCVEYRGGGNPEPGPESGDEPAHGGYEGTKVTSTVTVTGQADFYINDSRMVNSTGGTHEVRYSYAAGRTVDFYFDCFITERYTELKINGEDYYNKLPDPSTEEGKAALLAACKGQLNEFKITVPYSESYNVEAEKKWLDDTDKDYMVVGNFLWTYTDQNQGDDYIDHGRMEIIGIHFNGRDYSPEDLNNPGTAIDWGQNENGGSAVLPVGAVVTVKLVPDYGYQLTSFGINGGNFGTGGEQSTFTFEIKPGNAHLGAHFTPVNDAISSTSDTVTGGTIELNNDLAGGSAQLEIGDADLSAEKIEGFDNAAGDYTVTDYLDVDLYNVYYKGTDNADNAWKNEIDELEKDAEITVELADDINAEDVVILHNIHDGEEYETIPVESYDADDNTVTFKTDSFSAYAIAVKKGTVAGKRSPKTGDDSSLTLWIALMLISCAGAAGITIYSRRKKSSAQ